MLGYRDGTSNKMGNMSFFMFFFQLPRPGLESGIAADRPERSSSISCLGHQVVRQTDSGANESLLVDLNNPWAESCSVSAAH